MPCNQKERKKGGFLDKNANKKRKAINYIKEKEQLYHQKKKANTTGK
jgi:hypothetical protein